ncbi:MAG: hypothetical protein M1833_002659 [Piccolia ochrophora]|nr:MAG: hypothetical protein M1833_002659 [Piccolia ochrophora]
MFVYPQRSARAPPYGRRLPPNKAAAAVREIINNEPQMSRNLLWKLQHYFPHHDPKQGSMFAHIMGKYATTDSLKCVARTSKSSCLAVRPVLWSEINVTISGIWEGYDRRQMTRWIEAVHQLQKDGNYSSQWTREININDSTLRSSQPVNFENLTNVFWAFLTIVADLDCLRIFRWNCGIPFPVTLLHILASKNRTLKSCQFTFDAKAFDDHDIPHPERILGLEQVSKLMLGPQSHSDVSISVPRKIKLDCANTDIVLKNADSSSVFALSNLMFDHFVQVQDLRIHGRMMQSSPLPIRETEASPSTPLEKDQFRKLELTVRSLKLSCLGAAASRIVPYIQPEYLRDLQVEWCVDLQHTFAPLARRALNLTSFKYVSPTDIETLPGEEPVLLRVDQAIVTDFLRSATSKLKAIDITASYSDGMGPGQRAYLFAGIQAHLPSLEHLYVVDGESNEFSRKEMMEIATCAQNLVDLRIRAMMPDKGSQNYGLLPHLAYLLPHFRQLESLVFLRSSPKIETESNSERTQALALVSEAAKRIPLKFVGYDEEIGEDSREWLYRIARRGRNGEVDFEASFTSGVDLRLVSVTDNVRYMDVMRRMTECAHKLGVQQRGYPRPRRRRIVVKRGLGSGDIPKGMGVWG